MSALTTSIAKEAASVEEFPFELVRDVGDLSPALVTGLSFGQFCIRKRRHIAKE